MCLLLNIDSIEISLENLPKTGGNYPAVNSRDSIAYVAIPFPIKNVLDQQLELLSNQISAPQAFEASRICFRKIIGQVQKSMGFENCETLNHLDNNFQIIENRQDAPIGANKASNIFAEVFHEADLYARANLVLPSTL